MIVYGRGNYGPAKTSVMIRISQQSLVNIRKTYAKRVSQTIQSSSLRFRGYISTVKKNEMPVFVSLLKVFECEPFIPSAANRTG